MKHVRQAALLALSLILVGCSGSGPRSSDIAPPSAELGKVPPPEKLPQASDLALIAIDRPAGEPHDVTLGMTPDDAFRVFPRKGALEFEDIPSGFADSYRARHWEDGRQHGFGVISYSNRIVSAMYQEDGATPSRLEDFIRAHESRLGTPVRINGANVSYCFWEASGQRLMICGFHTTSPGIQITVALGIDSVMDALGASESQAQIAVRTGSTGKRINPSIHPG